MAIQKTEAFVLKTYPLRSSSLIVTFFSSAFGKMKGIAKGVRREREVRGALFELFTHLDIVFYEKSRSDLHLISEAAILQSHDNLRQRFDTIAYASYFSDLADTLTEVHDPHPEIFSLLSLCYRYLPSIPGERIARLFEVKLLNAIGWLPHLDGCLQCRNSEFEKGFFSVSQGALLCAQCAPGVTDARTLAPETLALIRQYVRREGDEAIRVRASAAAEEELGRVLEKFLQYRLPGPLKSRQFMESVKSVLV